MTSAQLKLKQRAGRFTSAHMCGLTLIEMLIAMTLSIFVMGGILILYVNIGESATYMNAASRVQENGRFAIGQLARTMRMAGYDPLKAIDPSTAPARPSVSLEGKLHSSVSIANFTLQSGTDAVLVSHGEGPQIRDCQGVEVYDSNPGIDVWVKNTYAIWQGADSADPADNELICETTKTVLDIATSTATTTTAAAQVIAEGIEGMVILYGVDSPVVDGVADRYKSAGNVSDWAEVVSAKISLLVNSVEPAYSSSLLHACKSCEKDSNGIPALWGALPDDNLMRAEFHTTIQFRN